MKVAISLVNYNCQDRVQEMVSSLDDSDVHDRNELVLFHFNNGSTQDVSIKSSIVEVKYDAGESMGIVEPRRFIFKKASWGGFDALLEVHTDMLFPKKWFQPLSDALDPGTAVAMPLVINGPPMSRDALEDQAKKHRNSNNMRYNTAHVLPWLINLKVVRPSDYYDIAFDPMRCEDDDFIARLMKGPYRTVTTHESVVFHEGALTRRMLGVHGKCNDNEKIFSVRHGFTPSDLKAKLGFYPVIATK